MIQDFFDPATFRRPDALPNDNLYVITPVFKPQRFRTRWKHYKNSEKHVLDSGAHLLAIEASFGERAEVIKEVVSDHHSVIHVRTNQEIWIKENMINVAMQFLPPDWKYVAWCDADIKFIRPDWVGETLQQLQHYDIVQMFSKAIDANADYEGFHISYGFAHDYVTGYQVPPKDGYYYEDGGDKWNHWHTGYAWAARRTAIDALGGLIHWGILVSSDNHMAKALIGQYEKSVNMGVSDEYKYMLKIWQERALTYIKRNIGYVKGDIYHHFHGAKVNRRYKTRWQILVEEGFTPSLDLKKDSNGIYQLTERNYKLRDKIRAYFAQRNEDSISMEGVKDFGL